jgi:hypothetical protein
MDTVPFERDHFLRRELGNNYPSTEHIDGIDNWRHGIHDHEGRV